MVRRTRSITLTKEGEAFLDYAQRLLLDLAEAENAVSLGGVVPTGHLRLTAPAGFGRIHVAPLVPHFKDAYPAVTISLELSDRLTDIVAEGFDLAVRIAKLEDSSLVGIKLAENRRVVVASPAYLARRGTPLHPQELVQHDCLTFGASGNQSRGWLFNDEQQISQAIRVHGPMECSDGAVLHEWALKGYGLAWRSMWEVAADLRRGSLVSVLDRFAAPATAIYAIVPQRKHLPLRVRAWIDFLKQHYSQARYWETH